jgi:hypothetical protein
VRDSESDPLARCLAQIEAALDGYRRPDIAAASNPSGDQQRALDASPHAENSERLAAVEASARHLAHVLGALDDQTRSQLFPTGGPQGNLHESLRELLALTAERAAVAVTEPVERMKSHKAPETEPHVVLLDRLVVIWERHTDHSVARDLESRSPFALFVETTFSLVGIDRESAQTLRRKHFEAAGLSDSVEMLESILEQ